MAVAVQVLEHNRHDRSHLSQFRKRLHFEATIPHVAEEGAAKGVRLEAVGVRERFGGIKLL